MAGAISAVGASAKKKAKAATHEEAKEEEEYEVERILEERGAKYHVKWKGYPEEEATWEPKHALTGCKAVLRAWAAAASGDGKRRTSHAGGNE